MKKEWGLLLLVFVLFCVVFFFLRRLLKDCEAATDSVTLKIMEREGAERLFHWLSVAAVVATVTI